MRQHFSSTKLPALARSKTFPPLQHFCIFANMQLASSFPSPAVLRESFDLRPTFIYYLQLCSMYNSATVSPTAFVVPSAHQQLSPDEPPVGSIKSTITVFSDYPYRINVSDFLPFSKWHRLNFVGRNKQVEGSISSHAGFAAAYNECEKILLRSCTRNIEKFQADPMELIRRYGYFQ